METSEPTTKDYLDLAIDKADGQTALAEKLTAMGFKTDQGNISYWVKTGRVPPNRVMAIEAITGVSRELLRPDVFLTEIQADSAA